MFAYIPHPGPIYWFGLVWFGLVFGLIVTKKEDPLPFISHLNLINNYADGSNIEQRLKILMHQPRLGIMCII